ncbi:LuxR C-terminal-related transcriptional regulator [Streptomyces sp. O3]
MLDALGLAPTAETVYRLVLDEPTWGVRELSAHLAWPEEAVREALDTLADLRLLHPGKGSPSQLRPVRPELGLSALLSSHESELRERQRQIEASRAAVAAFAAQYTPRREYVADVVERHEGPDAVRGRLRQLVRSAHRECLSFLPGGARTPDAPHARDAIHAPHAPHARDAVDALAASEPLDRQALERGVVLRGVYQESVRNDPSAARHVRRLAALGGDVRTVPALPMFLVIVDQQTALVPLDPADGRAGALELRSPGTVAAMTALFEQIWSVGVPWGNETPRDGHGLSPREQELLRLLAVGHTDEIASRRLGVSLRTVRRTASDLMARLGARSRFEAGARAERRGWL